MYNVNLEVFQGPLDLLLHLIEKMEIDIYNIEIAKLTESYLDYINGVDEISLENAEQYIVVAATLLHIKSKSLLPKSNDFEEDNQEEELVQQLIEYKNYKELSSKLEQLQLERSLFLEKEAASFEQEVSIKDLKIPPSKLLNALENIIKVKLKTNDEQIDVLTYREEISVEQIKNNIVSTLKSHKKMSLEKLILNFYNKNELVLAFISVLGMIKDDELDCSEDRDEIYIEYRGSVA